MGENNETYTVDIKVSGIPADRVEEILNEVEFSIKTAADVELDVLVGVAEPE
ncbi:hypothetical protein [Maridesulfovibrio sp.]|uniref:hypothetical protein n=1 Tax=Maridesulfovibrio sp. TaxID=2795000 RepID=UPI0029C9D26B|nr:hypothetical protein [Maridesulfovibrio sp.]